ncbi:MAG: prephenate dehydratase [Thiomonas sp.]|jgi:chorismate mutase/prephenate dehydratase
MADLLPTGSSDELTAWRERIDAIDRQILALLNQRAQAAQQIGHIKQRLGMPVFRPERERQVVDTLQAHNAGPLHNAGVSAIWREIMSACRTLEAPLRVAYLGPAGTFSEQAARRFFGSSAHGVACASIDDVFRSHLGGESEFAIVPVENSTEGAVARSMDLLLAHPVHLCGEVSLPVRHFLLRQTPELQGIDVVAAHAQALAQCAGWLRSHLPHAELRSVASNAEGARLAAADARIAAIAAEETAALYGLHIAARAIQDEAQNTTRFVVLGAARPQPTGDDRTSLILSVPNRAGAVYELLKPLAQHGVSMTRFESRPARSGQWEYAFYIDIEGHQDDPEVAMALRELQSACAMYKCLGSYPIDRTPRER